MATRWFFSAQTGIFSATSDSSPLALVTTPTVVAVPTDSMSGSLVLMLSTTRSSAAPTTRSSSLVFMMNLCSTGGNVPGLPTTRPVSPSDLVMDGSSLVPMAIRPPGFAVSRLASPAWSDSMVVVIFSQITSRRSRSCGRGDLDLVPDLQLALHEGAAQHSSLERIWGTSRGC